MAGFVPDEEEPKGFVPDADAAPAQVVDSGPGQAETFALHTAEGLTSNFAGEIGGVLKALGPDARGQRLGPAYRTYRDSIQGRIDEGARNYPKTAIAGNLTGGLMQTAIPVVGSVTRVPGVGGGLSALGASRADLTQGEYGQAAKDVATGATVDLLTAGAFKVGGAGLQRLARGAPARQEARAVNDLLLGVKASVQDKSLAQLGGREAIPALLKREAIPKSALRDPAKLAEVVDTKLDEVGGALGQIYRQADNNVPQGVLLSKVEEALGKAKAAARERGDHRAMAVVDAEIGGLKSLYEDTGSVLSAQQLHGVVKRLGDAGYTRQFLDPSRASQLSRDMHQHTRELLQTHIDRVAKAFPDKVPGREQLEDLNARYSQLRALSDIADTKATRLARNSPSLAETFQQYAQRGADAFTIANGLVANPTAAVGSIAIRAAPYVPQMADEALIRVARAARSGTRKAELLKMGATLGLPRAVVAQVIADEDMARAQEAQFAPSVGP
jgi:hypothetical protein